MCITPKRKKKRGTLALNKSWVAWSTVGWWDLSSVQRKKPWGDGWSRSLCSRTLFPNLQWSYMFLLLEQEVAWVGLAGDYRSCPFLRPWCRAAPWWGAADSRWPAQQVSGTDKVLQFVLGSRRRLRQTEYQDAFDYCLRKMRRLQVAQCQVFSATMGRRSTVVLS